MLDKIPSSRRLAILLSAIWLFVSGLFSSVIGPENFFQDFDATGRFLLTWLFVGMMPLGLIWGASLVIEGFRRERHQEEAMSGSKLAEIRIDQQRIENNPLRNSKTNYRRGLWRLWLVSTIFWYLYALASSAYQISEWVGFHYGRLQASGSADLAMEEKNFIAAKEACVAAREKACRVLTDRPSLAFPGEKEIEYIPNCELTQAFNDALLREVRGRGFDFIPNGEACPDLVATRIPYVDWAMIFTVVFIPFVLVVIYMIGRWIMNGFKKQTP